MKYATRTEVARQCVELTNRVRDCTFRRFSNLYYVSMNRPGHTFVVLVEWRKLTRKRATEVGMDSSLFERTR